MVGLFPSDVHARLTALSPLLVHPGLRALANIETVRSGCSFAVQLAANPRANPRREIGAAKESHAG
jgi:hypothetical protein